MTARYRILNERGEYIGWLGVAEFDLETVNAWMDAPAMRHIPATATEPERWVTWREAGYTVEEVRDEH